MIKYGNSNSNILKPEKAEFIFFDKGGTLSKPVNKAEDGGIPQFLRIMEILSIRDEEVEAFGKKISERDKAYKKWAFDSRIELSEEERCTRFLFPEYPPELVRANAEELTLVFSRSKGIRELRPEAPPVMIELHRRGYRLGIISNTVSRVLVPGEIEEAGLAPYIEALVMSSVTGIRKPEASMFLNAAEEAGVAPERCVYVGDQPNRDVEGPRQAGFGLNVILKTENYPEDKMLPEIQTPDIIVDTLEELLEIFP